MRNFTHIDVAQHLEDGTANAEWLKARLGRATGSLANDFLSKPKKPGEGMAHNLAVRLALERITGKSIGNGFQNQAMKDGNEREPLARMAYEQSRRVLVELSGFHAHNELMAGCSLDGHLGDYEGLIQIKCPEAATHWDTVRGGRVEDIETKYRRQIAHELWMTGAQWCDYVSFHPDFDPRLQLKVVRVLSVPAEMEEHDAAVRKFLQDVQTQYDAMRTMAEGIRVA